MRILLVCPEVPWPLDQGGRIRTFRLFVRGLSELGHYVDALFVKHNGQLEHRDELSKHLRRVRYLSHSSGGPLTLARVVRSIASGVPFANLKYCPPELPAVIAAMCADEDYDLVLAEHQHVADAVLSSSTRPVVVDMQNVYSDLYNRVGRSSRFSLKAVHSRVQEPIARRQERRLSRALGVLTASAEDASTLLRADAAARCFVVPNGVDIDFFKAGEPDCSVTTARGSTEPRIVMTGSMDYFPNSDGAIHLVRHVMPKVWEKLPLASVTIVGRDPGPEVRSLAADSRVTVTGAVADVRPYLEASQVAVVPLRSGSGTRLKALEAASMGKAIVGTTIGLEGISFQHRVNALIADEPEAMAECIVTLASDHQLARRLGEQARQLVQRGYSWDACCGSLSDALSSILGTTSGGARGLA